MTVAEEKKTLRKQALALRNKLSEEERHKKSGRIIQTLSSLDCYKHSDIILTYVEYLSEVSTTPCIKRALSENKQIFVPKVTGKDMDFYRIGSLSQLSEGYKGIREPWDITTPFTGGGDYDKADVLMLMPGAVFDRFHHRIGYGMGFYDRYLEYLYTSGISVYTAALCYECQMFSEIPYDIHDRYPDIIITEERIYDK